MRSDVAAVGPGSMAVAAGRDPVVVILFLAGLFDALSGNPIHSLLLLSTAAALALDGARRRSGATGALVPAPARAVPARAAGGPAAAVALAFFFAIVAGGFARYSWPVTALTLVPCTLALLVAWRGPVQEWPDDRPLDPLGAVAWAAVFVALAIWELTSLLLQPSFTTDSYDHPTISVLMDPFLAHHPGRTIALFVWLIAGWFLVQR